MQILTPTENVQFCAVPGKTAYLHFNYPAYQNLSKNNLLERFHNAFSLHLETIFLPCNTGIIKGAGPRNRKQTCYLHNLYCCPLVAIMFSSDFSGWGESTIKLLLKIHQYLCNPKTCECLVCFSTKVKGPSSKEHLYFEKSSGKSL